MIICYLDVVSIVIAPHETKSILVTDADAVLPIPVPLEFFQAIAGRNLQVLQIYGCIQHRKFSFRDRGGRRASSPARFPDFRRFRGGETLDHTPIIMASVNNVNRYYSSRRRAMVYSFPK